MTTIPYSVEETNDIVIHALQHRLRKQFLKPLCTESVQTGCLYLE